MTNGGWNRMQDFLKFIVIYGVLPIFFVLFIFALAGYFNTATHAQPSPPPMAVQDWFASIIKAFHPGNLACLNKTAAGYNWTNTSC